MGAEFDEVGGFAAEDECEEVEIDAGVGEDVGNFGRGDGEVAEGGGVYDGGFGEDSGCYCAGG